MLNLSSFEEHHITSKELVRLENTCQTLSEIGLLKWSSSLQIQDKVFWGSAHSSQLFPAALLCSFFNESFWRIFYGIHLQNLSIRAYTKGFCS
jgi:hypothetical protein